MAQLDEMTKNRLRLALEALSLRVRPDSVYLFGSRAEGGADEWSDYDLAAFLDGAEHWDIFDRARLSAEVQKEAGDDIELHVFPAEQARTRNPAASPPTLSSTVYACPCLS